MAASSDLRLVDALRVRMLRGAKKGVHRPLAIGGDEDQASARSAPIRIARRRHELDPEAADRSWR